MVEKVVDQSGAGVVEDDDRVGALAGDVQDEAVSIIVVKIGSVPAFVSPGVAEDETSISGGVDGRVGVVEIPVETDVVRVGSGLDGLEGRDGEGWGVGAGTTSSEDGTVGSVSSGLSSVPVVEKVVGIDGIQAKAPSTVARGIDIGRSGRVTIDGQVSRLAEWKNAVIFHENMAFNSALEENRPVIQISSVDNVVGTVYVIHASSGFREVGVSVLTELIPGCEYSMSKILAKVHLKKRGRLERVKCDSPGNNISKSILAERTILNRSLKLIAPKTAVSALNDVESCSSGLPTSMESTPIAHDIALEAELGLEQTVEEFAVLATVRIVDSRVRTHDTGSSSLDGILEWPQVELMHAGIVDISGVSDGTISTKTADCSVGFLFVSNEVL